MDAKAWRIGAGGIPLRPWLSLDEVFAKERGALELGEEASLKFGLMAKFFAEFGDLGASTQYKNIESSAPRCTLTPRPVRRSTASLGTSAFCAQLPNTCGLRRKGLHE